MKSFKGSRALIGFAGNRKDLELPARELVLFPSLGEQFRDASLPATEDAQASIPSTRDAAAAWWLLVSDHPDAATPDQLPSLSIDDLAELLYEQVGLTEIAGLWRWLHGGQPWFRLRRDRSLQPRGREEIRRDRRSARAQQLEQEKEQRQLQLLSSDRSLSQDEREGLSPGWQDTLDRLLDLVCTDQWMDQLDPELDSALQRLGVRSDRPGLLRWLTGLGLLDPHQPKALRGSVWSESFQPDLLNVADELINKAPKSAPGDEQRLDLTGLTTYTIDDAGTVEIDDGLALEQTSQGDWIWIHIADPARLIAEGSPLDLEARRRATTLYLADRTLPMLPLQLAADCLSLRTGSVCPALSVAVKLDQDGSIAARRITRSWINVRYRLTYDEGDELIELAPPGDESLERLAALLKTRLRWRLAQGALAFDRPEGRFRRQGDDLSLQLIQPSPSRVLVSEAMLLMGAVVAEFGREKGLPLPFRSQPAAELPSAAELALIPDGPARDAAIKRCLSRGQQGTTPMPHFSLGLPAYVQATSPIRRYADLIVHRQLIACLDQGEPMQESTMQERIADLEDPLRQSNQISREDQRHWQHVWFETRPGQSWSCEFLRWLRPQDRLALVHVNDLAMGLVGRLDADEPRPGQSLQLKVTTSEEGEPPLLTVS